MARPFFVNLIKSSVILGYYKDFVLVLLFGYTNQPIVEKGQVRLADGAEDDGAIFGDEGSGFGQRVVSPFGKRRGIVWEHGLGHS